MTVITSPIRIAETTEQLPTSGAWSAIRRSGRVVVGGGILLLIVILCILTLFFTLNQNSSLYYAGQTPNARVAPNTSSIGGLFGYDALGRSLLGRCLLGGTISLAVGAAAAAISVVLGTPVGLIAGYRGGRIDSL